MRKLIFITASFLLPVSGFCAAKIIPEQMPDDLRLMAKKGIDGIYAIKLDEAQKDFEEIVGKYPESPIGHFGLAMTKWARLEYQEEESNPQLDGEYLEMTDNAVDIGVKWLKRHPRDANAYMCLGGMYGLRARLAVMQHKWLRAYIDGRKAISATKKSLKIDPELYDAYLGLGMYEYYAGTLPGVIRILAKLFVRGNAEKGLEYLNICREKGFFNALAAELLLIEIYTQTGSPYSNPPTAVKWSKELRKLYPVHPMMHFVEIVSLYENKQWSDVRDQSLEYIKYIEEEKPMYRKTYLPRALLAVATTHLVEKDYDKALEYFLKAAGTLKEAGAVPNRWAVWSVVRLGNIHDLKGAREAAIGYYKEALSYNDNWGFKEYITNYLKKPFRDLELPGQLPPP